MTKKNEAAYTDIFKYIHNNLLQLNCQSVMTDYELAMRNAFQNVCNVTQMNTCWFHFCQAVKKKSSQVAHFRDAIKKDKAARTIYYKLLALPLLPASEIKDAFFALKHHAITLYPVYTDFLKYYEKQWILKVIANKIIYNFWSKLNFFFSYLCLQEGPEKISVFKLQNRTTSALEAYNGVLGKKVVNKGNFYKFVELIQEIEFEKGRDFDLLIESGGAVVREKKRNVNLIQFLNLCMISVLYGMTSDTFFWP